MSAFFAEKVSFIGHTIFSGRSEIAKATNDDFGQLQGPTPEIEKRLFLGLYNLSGRYFPSFPRVAAPLNCKLGEKRNIAPALTQAFKIGRVAFEGSVDKAADLCTYPAEI